ncbi:sodium-dependent transporter [Alkanindiges sp. WGS2144]|uniref:sodium-dependent transporter n=1 Tax=Alkanindiges sp. WGS2144 TaxID=3366808 RepID=UPI003753DCE2
MSQVRESWSARSGFIFAAVGSAVGLGNIWRFPYVAYENGGGAFLLPYLIALLTAGLPLLFLDYIVGHKYRSAAPLAYQQVTSKAQSLGWWQVMVCLFIGTYYASVLAWAASYVYFSFGQKWQAQPEQFFMQTYLQSSSVSSESGSSFSFDIIPHLFFPIVGMWILVLLILYLGIKRGVELSNKIFIPLLIVLFGVLVIQAVRLPGAVEGLNAFFTPNWQAMTDYKVWLAAYGHIFFSLSVGFGIMVTYASYLGKKANLTGSGLVVGLANSSFEILAGIGVFAALGFMAHAQGVPVSEVVSGGIGLAFIAFPQLISSLGAGGDWFGFLFFSSLVVAGVTSLVSVMEVPISAFQDKTGCSRQKAVLGVGGGTALVSIVLFSTANAIALVDIIDHFVNNIGIVLGAFLSIILVTWIMRRKLLEFTRHSNQFSSIKLGKVWQFLLTVVTPVSLLIALVLTMNSLLREGYGNYPSWLVMTFGWGSLLCCLIGALLLNYLPQRNSHHQE